MKPTAGEVVAAVDGAGWCCPYCAAPLETTGSALACVAEGRWFARQDGVARLLTEERRRETMASLDVLEDARREAGDVARPGLPEAGPGRRWRTRGRQLALGMEVATRRLGPGPLRILQVFAGTGWAAARLSADGHHVVAVDPSADASVGLGGVPVIDPAGARVARGESDLEALPLEPAHFDVVLAIGALHHAARLSRTLVELRRVTRRRGVLVAFDTPVVRRRRDGEVLVEEAMARQRRRYGTALPRELQPGYLVLDELPDLFDGAGWRLGIAGWPGVVRELAHEVLAALTRRPRPAWFPLLVARREG